MTKIVVLSSVLAFAFFVFSCEKPQKQEKDNTSKVDKIEELIGLYTEYEGFNGSVLVAHEGEVIYKNGFGQANMEWDIPNQSDTKFRLASITKPFTAILIMQLVAEGKLKLHEPITTYLPNYPKKYGSQITIHHILTHSSGIVRDYDSHKKNKFPDKQRLVDLVQEFSNLPLEFKPGERFEYSNSGFLVLGHIIERITGKPYDTVLQEKIVAPLNMENTGADKHRVIQKNRAKGYFKGFGEYFNSNYIDMSGITAVGNLYSTVEDMYLLDQGLYNETLLPKEFKELMFKRQITDSVYGGHYGYGWELVEKPIGNTNKKIETIGHSGAIDGFCALFTRMPSNKSSIVLLNNTRRAYLNAITTAVTGILNDQPYNFPKKPLAKFMTQVIEKKGVVNGVLFYKEHKDNSDYYKDEQELIVAGYRFLHDGSPKNAAAIFKLSTEVFPDRDNPYDSYGEALLVLGDTLQAIKNYKKSVQLNPNNRNGIKVLKKLGVKMDSISK